MSCRWYRRDGRAKDHADGGEGNHLIGGFRTRARLFVAALLKEKLEPGRAAAAVFVGIFIGIVPIYGFQTLAAVGAAFFFRLNKPLTVAGTFINNPLLQPAIIVSSVEIGYFLQGGSFRPFHLSALTGAHVKQEMMAFVMGSVAAEFLGRAASRLHQQTLQKSWVVLHGYTGGRLIRRTGR